MREEDDDGARRLTVQYILENGFREIASWRMENGALVLPKGLPKNGGVYAFAIGDSVCYVGKTSMRYYNRLYGYRKPGPTQQTNIRIGSAIMNTIAGGDRVRIFLAEPGYTTWKGFRVSLADGLEAALIKDYRLIWNVAGSKG